MAASASSTFPTYDPYCDGDMAITDPSGAFSIKQVPPGDYGLLVWESIPGDAFRNADFLKDYDACAVKVQVPGGSTILSNLKIIPR